MGWKENTEMFFEHFEEMEKELLEQYGLKAFTYTDLQLKVLSGYTYSILSGRTIQKEERKVNLYTGKGGVLMYIDACKSSGIPPAICAESIRVHFNQGAYNLLQVSVKNKDDYEQPRKDDPESGAFTD